MPACSFDSLRQAVRADDLVRTWEAQWHIRRTRDASLACMPRERVDRTRRAFDYLYRRVLRAERTRK